MKVLLEHHQMEQRNVRSILELVNVENGERTILQEFDYLIEAPQFTVDGKALVYNSNGLLYQYCLESKEITQIDSQYCNACNNDHILSPDGTKVAVSHHTYEDGQSRIYIVGLNGEQPVLVTPIAPSYLHGWSPDNQTLAYCAERNGEYDIYTISVNGGVETKLTSAPGLNDGPEYSPCGNYIWFNSVRTGLMQVFRMEKDGANQMQMIVEESNNWFPHVSPDGTKVVYIAYRKGDVDPGDHPANKNVQIRIMSAEGGESQCLVPLFGGQGTMNVNSWSPDSKTIAFVSYQLKQ